MIQDQLIGPLLKSRTELLPADSEEIRTRVESLEQQTRVIHKAIDRLNPHFWSSMLDDTAPAAVSDYPTSYSPGSNQEACLIVGYNMFAW